MLQKVSRLWTESLWIEKVDRVKSYFIIFVHWVIMQVFNFFSTGLIETLLCVKNAKPT